jgi:3-oxoacyl-[acyl-carrier protein] reductase
MSNPGAEQNLDSAAGCATSARSAYVSGQVVRVGKVTQSISIESQPLAGNTILVTGASHLAVLGEAIARVLAGSLEGAHVICLDIYSGSDLQK